LVCINKSDVYPAGTAQIEAFCRERGVEVAGHIPYDVAVTQAIVAGQPVTAYAPAAPASQALREVWTRVLAAFALERV
jgi:MinD superfamily P-loop ATPase